MSTQQADPAQKQQQQPQQQQRRRFNAPDGRSQDRRGGDNDGLIERVVKIRRVSKVVKGGRNIRFNALVVMGDGKGRVGIALGRSTTVVEAIRKGNERARKNMVRIAMRGTTIPHQVTAKFSATKVLLKPAGPGTGIIAGGSVRSVVEAAGITDILTKRFGSNNAINTAKATIAGLTMMLDPEKELERRYGRPFTGVQQNAAEPQQAAPEAAAAPKTAAPEAPEAKEPPKQDPDAKAEAPAKDAAKADKPTGKAEPAQKDAAADKPAEQADKAEAKAEPAAPKKAKKPAAKTAKPKAATKGKAEAESADEADPPAEKTDPKDEVKPDPKDGQEAQDGSG